MAHTGRQHHSSATVNRRAAVARLVGAVIFYWVGLAAADA